MQVTAIVNDTVGTLMARAIEDHDCLVVSFKLERETNNPPPLPPPSSWLVSHTVAPISRVLYSALGRMHAILRARRSL